MQTCDKPKDKSVAYNLIVALGQDGLTYRIKAGHLCWVMKYCMDFGFSGQKMFRSVNERLF